MTLAELEAERLRRITAAADKYNRARDKAAATYDREIDEAWADYRRKAGDTIHRELMP